MTAEIRYRTEPCKKYIAGQCDGIITCITYESEYSNEGDKIREEKCERGADLKTTKTTGEQGKIKEYEIDKEGNGYVKLFRRGFIHFGDSYKVCHQNHVLELLKVDGETIYKEEGIEQ